MGYLIATGMILLGLWKPSSKKVTTILLLYMWVLVAFNYGTPDYAAYEEMFLSCFEPRYALHEPGFMCLCKICLKIGLTYVQFRAVVAALMALLIWKGLGYFTENLNYALSLYLIFPFAGNASGLRNSVAGCIFYYAIRYLFSRERGAVRKYVIGILIAATFHYSMLFFLILLLARIRTIDAPTFALTELVLVPAFFAAAFSGVLLKIGSKLTKSQKVLNWLSTESAYFSPLYVISLGLFAMLLLLLWQGRTHLPKEEDGNAFLRINADAYDILTKAILISLLAFAAAVFRSVVYLRLVLTLLPVSHAFLAETYCGNKKVREIRHYSFSLERIALVCLCFLTMLFVYGYWIGISFIKVFSQNRLIELL